MKADVTYTPQDGYIGKVEFQESGTEEGIISVEERIEEDDDLFEQLIFMQ